MKNESRKCRSRKTCQYKITVESYLDQNWSQWFDGFQIEPKEDGETVIIGDVHDQADLHGVIKKIRDLGLHLVSVEQLCCRPQQKVKKCKRSMVNE